MYMHQVRLLHVHTASLSYKTVEILHPGGSDGAVLLTVSGTTGGVAASLIGEILGREAARLYCSSGRTFPLRHRGRFFSVSRTSAVTALAVSNIAVGLDIERRIQREAVADLAWTLSADERFELERGEVESRLTEIWTTKEASGKALGTGLGAAPYDISTRSMPDSPGCRVAELSPSGLGLKQVLTFGWWHADDHIRLAWPLQ